MSVEGPIPLGSLPPLGDVPRTMYANAIRQSRLGEPRSAFAVEVVDTPDIAEDEALVAVMASGINYNNVWAAQGIPIDVIAVRQKANDPRDFHIGGSDASGIVYAVGEKVTDIAVGDEVVVHHGTWSADDPWVLSGRDPMIAPSAKIWGYETNYGSFGQFAVVQAHQCMPKAPHLSWAEAAASSLVGTTAYRMLFGWAGSALRAADVVLVWGGSGGLGTQAIQLVKQAGGIPVAVVSSESRGKYCMDLGAVGFIDRTEFNHWGIPPHWTDNAGQRVWTKEAQRFGKRIWEVVGERRNPAIVFEHPGEHTMATSMFVCEPGGMVVICAGTTGYSPTVDLRYLWTRQKRLQGSHGTNDEQANAYNQLLIDRRITPGLGEVRSFREIGEIHQAMKEGRLPNGNSVVLVGAPDAESGRH